VRKPLLFVFFLSITARMLAQASADPHAPSQYQMPAPSSRSGGGSFDPAAVVNPKDSNDFAAISLYKISPDSTIRIGLILPFEAQSSTDRLNAAMTDNENSKNDNTRIKEASQDALDFYEGLRYAVGSFNPRQKISFYIFDSQNSDSVVQELVRNDSLRICDIIIGPTNPAQSKIIASYCKRNRIINIQPFVASKSFSTENPYLVRFMPTIDAHLQIEYEMVIDRPRCRTPA
jgi:hypothetical protein